VFDSLSPEHQKILVDCAAELQDWDWKYKREVLTKERLQELRDFGLVVTFPTMEERVLWESIREKVWNEMAEKFKDKLDMKTAYKFYNSEKK
jgi:TRAP-type C4-dicarboxylate transport system substrate-binding protein